MWKLNVGQRWDILWLTIPATGMAQTPATGPTIAVSPMTMQAPRATKASVGDGMPLT